MTGNLALPLLEAAAHAPEREAVVAPDGAVTYGALDRLAAQAAALLRLLGVRKGDRVGLYARKGVRTLALMQAALRAGAIYVPIDPASPPARAATALAACGAALVAASAADLDRLSATGLLGAQVRRLATDDAAPGLAGWNDVIAQVPAAPRAPAGDDALAYILYTSGSTGPPKGVCITHRNALAFVEWAVERVGARAEDAFANHAPYNFDLSVFDIYGAFLSRARLITVPEESALLGGALVTLCRRCAVSIWYSVPTALALMLRDPAFNADTLPWMRALLYAGEVCPLRTLHALRRAFPAARLFNFYGPTETNVCTAYEIADVDETRATPIPIGSASCGNRVWALTPDGRPAAPGETGELLVQGPTVAHGYWGRPFPAGEAYRTGDCVRVLADGQFEFVGRLDRMVKLRGYRVELGEVEAALLSHPAIADAAVTVRGDGADARLVAAIVTVVGARPPSLLNVKRHCAARLPPYMTVSDLRILDMLPRTANGKIDYQRLAS